MSSQDQGDGSVLTTLFRHNIWANVKLLDFCQKLSEEQLDATGIGCYGPIHGTLLHIIGAEVSYVRRFNGRQPPRPFARDQFPGFDVLRDAAHWSGQELLAMALAARTDTMVEEHAHGKREIYPLPGLILQSLTHSTEHRTQISAIITQLGMEPPDMSGWCYIDEMGQIKEFDA